MGAVLLAAPVACLAASCTTQAALNPLDRDALAIAGGRVASSVVQQNFDVLHSLLLPAEAQNWENIRGAVEDGAALFRGGHAQIRSLYLLDSTMERTTADTEFFCSNQNGSLTVTITLRALPPGRYAVVLADAAGTPMAGQMAFILVWDGGPGAGWKLGGVSVRQGTFDGHDGVWYWTRARELAQMNLPWAAWFSYAAARYLLLPVDFLSSPNLERLETEQSQIKNSPPAAFPYMVPDGARTWKIDSVQLDPTLRLPDLGVTYESTGVADPAAQRTEAVAVLSAFLKTQPALRQNFHGLWAYAVSKGKRTPIMGLPMAQIP